MNNRLDVLVTNNVVADASETFQENITRYIDGAFSFTSQAQGGYATATFSLKVNSVKAYQILADYLGKRIVFTSPHAGNVDLICWEGLIYTITIDDGASSVSRSLANVYNHVGVRYAPLTYDASNNAVYGATTITPAADYTPTQALYGMRELLYPIGGVSDANAINLRDLLLSYYENAIAMNSGAQHGGALTLGMGMIVPTQRFGVRSSGKSLLSVTVDCVGIWETLDKRFYVQTASSAMASLDTIVKAALNPSTGVAQFANADQSQINANARTTSQYIDSRITAQKYLDYLCQLGGSNNLRYFIQLLENGRPYYFEQPTGTAYHAHRLDTLEAIYDATTGVRVPPWLVLPGRVITFDDVLPDAVVYSNDLANARSFLIGETIFTAPAQLILRPQVADPAQMKLSRIGMGDFY